MIRLTFEELTQQMLYHLLEKTAIQMLVEYSQDEKKVMVDVSYGGDRFDPAEGENQMSYKLLTGSVDEFSYEYKEGAETPNKIHVVIRE